MFFYCRHSTSLLENFNSKMLKYMPLKECLWVSIFFFFYQGSCSPYVLRDIFHPSLYSCTFTRFCLLRYIQKREFYFYFIAFCAQVLLAALDHNMHSFRPQATTKNGHLIFKKQYSNRTKNWHPEPFRAEKTHHYIQFLMASILKARVDDKESAARVISLPSDHPRNLAPTIVLRESPELI